MYEVRMIVDVANVLEAIQLLNEITDEYKEVIDEIRVLEVKGGLSQRSSVGNFANSTKANEE